MTSCKRTGQARLPEVPRPGPAHRRRARELFEDFDPSDLRHVAGVGLRLATPIGPFRLEYGAILDREPADESRGEFFISIGQAF